MNAAESMISHSLALAFIGFMAAWCLRSRGGVTIPSGRKVYYIHRGWFVFCALGGIFLVGIFAYASYDSAPGERTAPLICSIVAGLFFAFTAVVLRAASVTIDDTQFTATTLFGDQTALLRDIEAITMNGLVVEVRLRKVAGKKRARRITFLSGFSGLGELMASLRARAGLLADLSRR